MDSITQAALGAVVGGALAGHKLGGRALLIGAVAGTLPDLDVVAMPFMDDVTRLVTHRGVTHSLLVAPLAAAALAYFCRRGGAALGLGFGSWFWLFFWCFATHILLDLCTVYGTQILYPLSDYPFSLSSIFIIDPLFTLPLAAVIAYAALRPAARRSRRPATVALGVVGAYLAGALALAAHAGNMFAAALAAEGVDYRRLSVQAAPLNIALWRGIAITADGHIEAEYSALNADGAVWLKPSPASTHRALVAAAANGNAGGDIARLARFSKGFFDVRAGDDGRLVFIDLRFGFDDYYPFRYAIERADDMPLADARAARVEDDMPRRLDFRGLWRRIRGFPPAGWRVVLPEFEARLSHVAVDVDIDPPHPRQAARDVGAGERDHRVVLLMDRGQQPVGDDLAALRRVGAVNPAPAHLPPLVHVGVERREKIRRLFEQRGGHLDRMAQFADDDVELYDGRLHGNQSRGGRDKPCGGRNESRADAGKSRRDEGESCDAERRAAPVAV